MLQRINTTCFLKTTTPARSAARLHGQTVSCGGEGSGLSTDQVGEGPPRFSGPVRVQGGRGVVWIPGGEDFLFIPVYSSNSVVLIVFN